ncbi:MAG: hypothetical protein ACI8YQ_005008 [Polaribacter sp.]|jgi:hypothetical protein
MRRCDRSAVERTKVDLYLTYCDRSAVIKFGPQRGHSRLENKNIMFYAPIGVAPSTVLNSYDFF